MQPERWSRDVLAPYVHNGRVEYAALSNSPDLDALVSGIGAHDPAQESRDQQLAFYINAYNLLTIHQVLRRLQRNPDWPGAVSLLDKLRFFVLRRHRVAGRTLSLMSLENRVIRPRFGDARIHFALNCASRSCPPLPSRLFTGAELDADLDRLTRAFLHSEEVRYEPDGNRLSLSPIFKWYRSDFKPSVLEFIAGYRAVPADATVVFHDYDWRLNSV